MWRACRHATFFQSRDWAQVWSTQAGPGVEPSGMHVTFSDGSAAILPVTVDRRDRLRPRHLLSPATTFGGWLAPAVLSCDHTDLLVPLVLRRFGSLVWRLSPYDPAAAQLTPLATQTDETHAVDLAEGFDSVLRTWSRGARSSVRKAEKAGLEVDTAASSEDWDCYFEIYKDSVRRWGDNASSVYPRRLFTEIERRGSSDVKLWLVRHQGEPIAGALCFYAPEHVAYWSGAALEEHFSLRPVNLLLAEAMRHACDRGLRWFDLNPSGGHEGVTRFKRSLGARPLGSPIVRRTSFGARVARRAARGLRRPLRA